MTFVTRSILIALLAICCTARSQDVTVNTPAVDESSAADKRFKEAINSIRTGGLAIDRPAAQTESPAASAAHQRRIDQLKKNWEKSFDGVGNAGGKKKTSSKKKKTSKKKGKKKGKKR